MDNSRRVYGIDLGTTYSCIAQIDKYDQAVVLKNFEGSLTTPSVVYVNGDNIVVGEEAKGSLTSEPDKTIAFIKRHIGENESFKKPTLFPGELDPVELSALILKKLVNDANGASDDPIPITDVVITCPAYFGTKERVQTKQAGITAGLNVIAIINEPTAAAITYGIKADEEKMILVYDLGGGTFDVTMIRVKGGIIKVIATGGDHKLGGVDWDTVLAEYMIAYFNAKHNTSATIDSDPAFKYSVLLEAERRKKNLTAKNSVGANISYNGISERIELTRELFDQLTKDKLDETIEATRKVLEIAKEKGFDRVDEVYLVGGSSKMPQIKERVDREFNCNSKIQDPDECVAKGAVIYAMNEAFQRALEAYEDGDAVEKPKAIAVKTNIVNVTSKTYGTDISDNRVQNLIFANTSLPCKGVETFRTQDDNQGGVSMKIFESDVTDPETESVIPDGFANLLRDETLLLTKKWPKGTPVQVTFELDDEGILRVHAMVERDEIRFELKIEGVKNDRELLDSMQRISKMNIG